MAYTQTDLEHLQAQIARGVRKAKIDGEEVEFASLSDMLRTERKIKAALKNTVTRRTFVPRTQSGWR